jgi:hypothetical protein
MLPPFGFHDSCINSLTQDVDVISLELESVQEDTGPGELLLFSIKLTFTGVRGLLADGKPCEKITTEGDDGEIWELESTGKLVTMVVLWEIFSDPKKRVTRVYQFQCNNVNWERTSAGTVETWGPKGTV